MAHGCHDEHVAHGGSGGHDHDHDHGPEDPDGDSLFPYIDLPKVRMQRQAARGGEPTRRIAVAFQSQAVEGAAGNGVAPGCDRLTRARASL